jgi:Fic family protein
MEKSRRLREGFPLSNRLIREIHAQLLARGRGAEKQPGEFRASQNWIGGPRPGLATYVPPPPERVPDCMGDLERFLHEPADRVPVLLKMALAHVQFETIHPFLDGNGMLERLGIVRELTGKRRNRLFGYDHYVALLAEGTQPGVVPSAVDLL